MVRGSLTQAAFARQMDIDRSCLSRYENGSLGVPTKLLDYCLQQVHAKMMGLPVSDLTPANRALAHLRLATSEVETIART